MFVEELAFKIAKQLDFSYEDFEMLLHDIKNLRKDEWLDIVEKGCTKDVVREFKLIKVVI